MLTRCWSAAARAARRGAASRAAATAARLPPPPPRAAAGSGFTFARAAPCVAAPRRRPAPSSARGFGSTPPPPPSASAAERPDEVRVTVLVNGVPVQGEGGGADSDADEAGDGDADGSEAPLFEGDFALVDGEVEVEVDSDVEDGEGGSFEDDSEDELEEEDYEPTFTTGNVPWGETALGVARRVLSEAPFAGVLEMYSFRVWGGRDARVTVRLDKPSDRFGSPSVEDLSAFSTAFDAALEASGAAPQELTVEVSSAGAEREVRLPRDLQRFAGLPMAVRYEPAPGQPPLTEALELLEFDAEAGTTTWKLAAVRANMANLKKGQPMSKKMRERRVALPLAALQKVHLILDV